jgi:hypothetical protein
MMVPSPTFLNFKPPWIVHESTKVRKVQESTKSTVNEKKVHQTYKWSYNWQAQHPGHSPRTTSCVVLVSCLLLNVFGLCREPTSPNCNIVTGNREISSVCLACSAFAFPHSSARVDQRHDSSQSIRVYKYRSKVTHWMWTQLMIWQAVSALETALRTASATQAWFLSGITHRCFDSAHPITISERPKLDRSHEEESACYMNT